MREEENDIKLATIRLRPSNQMQAVGTIIAVLVAGLTPVAVVIDLAGCSYNPDSVQHQDAVAAAVAAEMSKALAQELRPQAPPRFAAEGANSASELDMLQVAAPQHFQRRKLVI